MNRKVPLWIFLLTVWFFVFLLVFFGWAVWHTSNGGTRLWKWKDKILWIAKLPHQANVMLEGIYSLNGRLIKYDFPANWSSEQYKNDNGYLLISYYNKSLNKPSIRLMRIKDTVTLYQWNINVDEVNKKIKNKSLLIESNRIFIHPYLDERGDLFLKCPFFVIKKNGLIDVISEAEYHHSTEIDGDNNFWLPSKDINNSFKKIFGNNYDDDLIVKLTKEGKILLKKSLTEILIQNGYRGLIWGTKADQIDPCHLNDIQPAFTSSPYWQKGDVFISLRHLSTVFLYRPSTNKILWLKTGPWLNQHDVNIIDDHRISIFGNNNIRATGELIDGHNEVYIYDFKSDLVTTPYSQFLAKANVKTLTDGRGEILENGDLFIESTTSGCLFRGTKYDIVWQYVERQDKNHISYLNWSSYLQRNRFIDSLEKTLLVKFNKF